MTSLTVDIPYGCPLLSEHSSNSVKPPVSSNKSGHIPTHPRTLEKRFRVPTPPAQRESTKYAAKGGRVLTTPLNNNLRIRVVSLWSQANEKMTMTRIVRLLAIEGTFTTCQTLKNTITRWQKTSSVRDLSRSNQMQLTQGHQLNSDPALVLPAFGCYILPLHVWPICS